MGVRPVSAKSVAMKAVTVKAYGGADSARVEEHPTPQPGPAEVQIQVVASSLNPLDFKARTGELKWVMRAKPPKVLGGDFSGRVSALGEGVTAFAVGDEVFGCVDEFSDARGSHAEYCVAPVTALSRKPAAVSHEEAASLPMAGLTAYQALTQHAPLKAGQRLLVIGGSGGIGSVAVQLGKALGAHVTATASASNQSLLERLGADECLDHGAVDYATAPVPYNVVFDCAAASSYFHAMPVLDKGGAYLTVLPGPKAVFGMLLAPLFGHRVKMLVVKYSGADGEALAQLVVEGKVRPVLGKTLTLDQVPAAIEAMRLGQRVAGKQVVRVA